MLAYQLEINQPGCREIDHGDAITFDAQRLDCLTAIMLKILDGKCKMDAGSQKATIDFYKAVDKKSSHLFDLAVHPFIEKVVDDPDIVSLKHVHEMRLFVESAIPKTVMKNFKRELVAYLF